MPETIEAIVARIDAMAEAVEIVRATANAQPSPGIVQERVNGLATRVDQAAAASKEAIDKSERAANAAIYEQGKRLDDMKSRLDMMDGSITGVRSLILIISAALSIVIAASNLIRMANSEPQIVYVPSAPGMPPVTAAPQGTSP